MYEQIWIRELQEFFGSTIHSITTVVAAYMGGLGLGAWVIGRRVAEHPRPARIYGILEIAIGIFGIASPLIVSGIGVLYLALARVLEPGLWLGTAIKFVFAFAVMLVPTFMMGGTLPVLTQAFTGPRTERLRRELAFFYGLNTVGAVAGCALAGYVLIENAGLTSSLVVTGLVNLVLGGAALALAGGVRAPAEPAEAAPEEPLEAADPLTRRLAIWLVALTAFASLLYEIAWTRVLIMVVGSSAYAFTTILSSFLLGIGAGSLLASGRRRSVRELLLAAALAQGAIAVLASLLFPFFRVLPSYIVTTMQVSSTPTLILLMHGVALVAVVVPPAVAMGLAFPILADLAADRERSTGTETGRAYFANTLGSIGGAVLTGFLLIHTAGSERTLQLGVLINAVAAGALYWQLRRPAEAAAAPAVPVRLPLALGGVALAITLLTPGWSRRLLDLGPAIYGRNASGERYFRALGQEQLSFVEGWNSTISVWRDGSATWLKSNGKVDASSLGDMDTQVMLGVLPAVAHPAPRSAFVIGFGSGVTVRSVADVPGVEHVEVVEIERAVLRASRFFSAVNSDILADPRVRVIEDDARSALQLARRSYDVIVSEPSNPWIAGVASLYTPDFFRIVKGRLAEGGVFAQWMQLYGIPVDVVAMITANLRATFSNVELWRVGTGDLIALASDQPIRWQASRIQAHLDPATATGRAMREWLRVERVSDLLGYFVLSGQGTRALAATAPHEHTDDRPTLEFVAARGLLARNSARAVLDSLMALRLEAGDSIPDVQGLRLRRGEWQAAQARALGGHPDAVRLAQEAMDLAPRDLEFRGVMASAHYARLEMDSAMPRFVQAIGVRPPNGRLLLEAGIAALSTGELEEGRAWIGRALAAGCDSSHAYAVLGEVAIGQGDHQRAAAMASASVRALGRSSPKAISPPLHTLVRRLAAESPPELAAPVLDEVIAARPHWDAAYFGAALSYARWGGEERCERAIGLAAELVRFGWIRSEIRQALASCGRVRLRT